MALNNQKAPIINPGTVSAASSTSTEFNPSVTGTPVGEFSDYSDTFFWRITNGATAPTAPAVIVFYAALKDSPTVFFEVDRRQGDTVANSSPSGYVDAPKGATSFTAKVFGNQGANVTAEVALARQVP